MKLENKDSGTEGDRVPNGFPLFTKPLMRYGLILLAWSVIAFFFIRQSYVYYGDGGREVDLGRILSFNLTYFYTWALLTPLVLSLSLRFPVLPFHFKNLVVVGAAGFGVAALHGFIAALVIAFNYVNFLDTQAVFGTAFKGLSSRFFSGIPGSQVNVWVLLAIGNGLAFYRRYQATALRLTRAETQLNQARLDALKMQLHPHFMFNTLNTISSLLRLDLEKADQMIAQLSDFLRLTLAEQEVHLVPLSKELAFLKAYLEIEAIRFHDRLKLEFHLDSGLDQALVPYLMLQPVAENAVRHGIAPHSQSGLIQVSAKNQDGRLVITLRDDGPGLMEQHPRTGIGISNTRNRLALLYGDHQSLTLENHPRGGLRVTFNLPLKFSGN